MNNLIKKAFTLIELLVVIAIIGILSGLIIVGMNGMTNSATIAKYQVFSNSLRNSLMMNLVSEWKFDNITDYVENSGIKTIGTSGNNVPDSWGAFGYNHGTASGGPLLKEGKDCVHGKCIQFDGNNDYVNLGANLHFNNSLSISLWINPSLLRNNSYIIAKGWSDEYDLRLNSVGNITLSLVNEVYVHSVELSSISTISVNKWYYIVVMFDGTNVNLYINGVRDNHDTFNYTIRDSGQVVKLGVTNIDYDTWYQGLIDDVGIYNAAMPTSQIKEQYYSGLNKLLSNGEISKEEYLSRVLDLNNRYAKK